MSRRQPSLPHRNHHHYLNHCRNVRNNGANNTTAIDIGYSDDATSDTYYDYYDDSSFRHSPLRESRNFSDDSGSARLPYIEFDEESANRYSRSLRKGLKHSNSHRVYPNQDEQWDRLYHEIQTPCESVQMSSEVPRRVPTRASERPHSSLSSNTTTGVYGCGGKCQTFESVCYFFLQLVFTMGVLIGASLCIAGIVLRKSAARNLQVLIYIGVMLALVSALLLFVQCSARNTAKKRKKTSQNAKRTAPIPLNILNVRQVPVPSGPRESVRKNNIPQVHGSNLAPNSNVGRGGSKIIESVDEQGVPWWRRKDLNR